MKRFRQTDLLEEEPLSKRINNLHLDNPSFSSPNSPLQMMLDNNCNIEHYNINPHGMNEANKGCDAYNNNLTYAKNAQMIAQYCSGLPSDVNMPGNDVQTYHALQKMIENRELPESLCANYPINNPTDNSYYYNFNRVLHTVHLERLRRQGKI